jgi:hypothetical protein
MMKKNHSKVNTENHHQLTKNMHNFFALEFVDYDELIMKMREEK